jgi:hypothetical protein
VIHIKQIALIFIALSAIIVGCKSTQANNQTADTAKKLTFPFRPQYSINWQPGDEKNAVIVLNCLKKYIAGDVKGACESFSDTAEFIGDQFYFKGSKGSLATILGQVRGEMVTVTKTFDSWMTTYTPIKKIPGLRFGM